MVKTIISIILALVMFFFMIYELSGFIVTIRKKIKAKRDKKNNSDAVPVDSSDDTNGK